MIEILPAMPDGVTGIRVSGRVSRDDIRGVQSALDSLAVADEIRIVEIIAPDYEGFGHGGLAEDLKVGFGLMVHDRAAFKRIAVVTDRDWVIHTVHALAWMVPGELRTFGLDELDQAIDWAAD